MGILNFFKKPWNGNLHDIHDKIDDILKDAGHMNPEVNENLELNISYLKICEDLNVREFEDVRIVRDSVSQRIIWLQHGYPNYIIHHDISKHTLEKSEKELRERNML